MYFHGKMMVTFLSLLHVVYGGKAANVGKVVSSAVDVAASLIDYVTNALNSGNKQSDKGTKQECLQCVDARVDNTRLRDKEYLYRTPECEDAQTADESPKIILQTCIDVPNDGYVTSCGHLDGSIKLTYGNDKGTLYFHVRGCFKLDQVSANGCISNKHVINKQIEKLGIITSITEFEKKVKLDNQIQIGEKDGHICIADDATVIAFRTWWSVMLANFLLR